ncbi:hypothetical protein DFH08DRAFT_1079320 [Mycena albidolilacea]|uniref:Uncharacterized protein n=1 Tax=Mycena albidolilacea TaxID=1033008 RepID=A0AAD7A4J7_9AGAR|nr:hypothetical protein DFH08DRAFT_1079320 [Mycena albidolilacea]
MQSSVLFLLASALLAIAAPVQLQSEQDARDREVAPAAVRVAAIDNMGAIVDSENIGWSVDGSNVGWTVDGNNYYWVIGTHAARGAVATETAI